jgi:uncharacterized membrane protein
VRLYLLAAAAVCVATIGLITRFLNQPINAVVITWRSDSASSDWTRLRDEWWRWHCFRLAMGIIGLSLLIAATLKRAGADSLGTIPSAEARCEMSKSLTV